MLGLAALFVLLSFAFAKLWPAATPALSAFKRRPPASLESLKGSLGGMEGRGWQAWFQPDPDSGAAQWRVSVPESLPLVSVNLEIHRLSAASGIEVESAIEDRRRALLEIILTGEGGRQARLVVRKRPAAEKQGQSPPLLALVAFESKGDWGAQLKRLSLCPAVMTVAGGSRIKDGGGREAIAFVPMEPKGYPREDPGPNTLLVDDGPSGIRSKLSRIIDFSPKAVGLCVHYGSRAVEDKAVTDEVAEFCAGRGLALVEPAPTARSLVSSACRSSGVPYFSPDVFIAGSASLRESRELLSKAVRVCQSRGRALVLLPATDNALRAVRETFPGAQGRDCQLVPFSRLGAR